MLTSTLHIIWPRYLQSLKLLYPTVYDMLLQENTSFDSKVKVTKYLGSRSFKYYPVPSTSSDLRIHLQHLKLLQPAVYEQMHLEENTLFDLDLQGHT